MRTLPTHRPCVGIVVLRPSLPSGASAGKSAKMQKETYEVLIVHKPRRNDSWQVPQGGIEEGESIEGAAQRELEEETGIVLRGEHQILRSREEYRYDYPIGFLRAKKPKCRGQHLTFVTVHVSRETVVTVDKRELDAYTWIDPKELPKYLKRKNYRRVVERVVASAG